MANRAKFDANMAAKRKAFLDAAFALFSERGIEAVSLADIARASGYGTTTLYRYFTNKVTLVVELASRTWNDYIVSYNASAPAGAVESMTGAEWLAFYLDSFLDLYRNHKDILCFNYDLNSFLRKARLEAGQVSSYFSVVDELGMSFHELYRRGTEDGTLRSDVGEQAMFSAIFHLMLAAVTRYAVGLVYVYDQTDPEAELEMLKRLLLREYALA